MSSNESEPLLSRKEREKERHRAEILEAAERIFAQKGYRSATVEEIAKEAEFSIGALYTFFKSKEELYSRVIEKFINEFLTEFQEKVQAAEDPAKAIAALIELRLNHFEAHRAFIRVTLDAEPDGGMDPRRALCVDVRAIHDRFLKDVTAIFERGIACGEFDDGDPLYFTLALEGIIHSCVLYWARNEPVDPLQVRIAKLKREFLERIKVRLDRRESSGAVV